jgi:hypothetical protein
MERTNWLEGADFGGSSVPRPPVLRARYRLPPGRRSGRRAPDLLVFDRDVGRQRFKIPPLDALAVLESTTALRERLASCLLKPGSQLGVHRPDLDMWNDDAGAP